MSRARGVRGARKMRSFVKDRVVAVANEEDFEAALRSGSERLLVIEFAAVRARGARLDTGAHAARTVSVVERALQGDVAGYGLARSVGRVQRRGFCARGPGGVPGARFSRPPRRSRH